MKAALIALCRWLITRQMTRAEELKTEWDFFKANIEACLIMKWFGADKKQSLQYGECFLAEREFRRLNAHRVMEHPNLSETDKAVVSNIIEQSRARQNQCLDVMRGLVKP